MTPRLSLIYTTFSNEEDALRIGRELLEKRLVACINILGTTKSLCFWKERLEENKEVACLLKTSTEKVPIAIKELENLHPYEVPVILEVPVGNVSKSFMAWIQEATKQL